MKLTEAQMAELLRALLGRYRAVVREKRDAVEMRVVAAVFGVAALLGAPVPSADAFLARCWTTLGPVIYSPRGAWPITPEARVVFHELTHVEQFWRGPVSFVTRYLTSRGRAEMEAEAERAAMESWWLLTGMLPEGIDAPGPRIHGYALDDSHTALTRELLAKARESVARGVLVTDVGLTVAAWLRMHAPDAMVGGICGGVR